MGDEKGTDNEDIGRPGPWSETRYQPPGKKVDREVADAGQKPEAKRPAVTSTPVTRKDYTGGKS